MSKSVKPSGVTARKARLTRLFRELDDEDRYFEIKLVKGNKVVFLFGGYEIDFILENG